MQRQTTKWQCYTKGERSSRRQIRINQLDYLKCIFILLMIIFHLVYIGDKYPYLKQVVYTFHMPAFFIISGYLLNVDKGVRSFCNTMLWMFIPYAVMETGYVCMSSVLPVREKVEEVSLNIILYKIFVAPIGPYWYLHTLLICSLVYYTLNRLCEQLNRASFLLILGVCFGELPVGLKYYHWPMQFISLPVLPFARAGRIFFLYFNLQRLPSFLSFCYLAFRKI